MHLNGFTQYFSFKGTEAAMRTRLIIEIIVAMLSGFAVLFSGYVASFNLPLAKTGRRNFHGGVAFAIGIIIGCLFLAILAPWLFGGDRFHEVTRTVWYCVLAGVVTAGFLLIDWYFPEQPVACLGQDVDQRKTTQRRVALCLAMLIAVVGAALAGIRFPILGFGGGSERELGFWAGPLTVVWLIGATLSVKLLDGLNGAAHVVLVAACVLVFYRTFGTQEYFLNAFSLMVGIVSAAALRFSLHPARMPVAGGGTLAAGFLFAMLIVFARQKTVAAAVFMLPILAVVLIAGGAMLSVLEKQFTAEKK
jgi:UDP-N-acetylmuramyl pentapeptide phosphotransferase/UDP-N-acetylglucosamine-1-phosphate transferase